METHKGNKMSKPPTNQDQAIDELLDKYLGLLIMGNWQPRPGEEGMAYPTRVKNETRQAIKALIANARIEELESLTQSWMENYECEDCRQNAHATRTRIKELKTLKGDKS